MSLSTAANWAQLVSVIPLFGAVGALYWHHRCPDCFRLVRHGRSSCRRHS